jgi:hypothetical protein
MNLVEAVNALKNGNKVRRTDWEWANTAYLIVSGHYLNTNHLYIIGQYNDMPALISAYGMSFSDLESTNWEIVNG